MCSSVVIWPHSSTEREGCAKKVCIWGRTRQTKREPAFLKAYLFQQGDPYMVWSSTVLISTELRHLVGVINLVSCVQDSLLVLMQLSPLHLGKALLLSPPCLSLWPSNPPNALFIPLLFLKVTHALMASCDHGWASFVWTLRPWAWWQWRHNSAGFAAALLPASGPQHLPCLSSSPHTAISPLETLPSLGLPPHTKKHAFLPAAQHIEEVGVTLRCVPLLAVAHRATLNWFASYMWQ